MSRSEEIRRLRTTGFSIDEICKRVDANRKEILRVCRKAGMAITEEESRIAKQRQAEQFSHDDEWAKQYVYEMSEGRYEYESGFKNMDMPLKIRCVKCGIVRDIKCQTIRQQKWRGKTIRCNACYFNETEDRQEARRTEKEKESKRKQEEARLKRIMNSPCKQITFSFCKCGMPKNPRAKMCAECSRKAYNKNREIIRRQKIEAVIIDRDINLQKVYQRDYGICYLCGERCDWNDYIVTDKTIVTGNRYPSIDHVIPLARGGVHGWNNVRLAHRYCNSIKSDKGINETTGGYAP